MGADSEENAIVTSTGQYVVAWDFAKVKKGQLDKYEIKKCVCPSRFTLQFPVPSVPIGSRKANYLRLSPSGNRYDQYVVQDNFKFGDDKEIVCVLDSSSCARWANSAPCRSLPWRTMSSRSTRRA